jgi:tetratricopeptide (TPR) repeat protein
MTYSNYLEQLLNTPENNKNSLEYRVINCGAKTFSSRRVKKVAAHIIKNKEKYRPALISANFGTSEFLEYDAYKTYLKKKNQKKHWITNLKTLLYLQDLLGRLIKKSKGLSLENINSRDEYLKSVFVHPSQFISTLKERDLVLEEARKNIEQIADMCKKASIPLIINTIPGNLKWPPAAYTNNNDSAQIIKETGLLINGNTPQQALKVIENHLNRTATAPKSMPDNKKPAAGIIECAGLHYRSAQAWYALENYYKAREFYLKAKNTDAFPLRALDDYNSIIRSLAGPAGPANPTEPANQAGPALPSGIVVADIDKNISALFKHSIPDFSVYIDNCHPNSRGHKFTAEKIFKQCYQYLIKQDQSDNVFK